MRIKFIAPTAGAYSMYLCICSTQFFLVYLEGGSESDCTVSPSNVILNFLDWNKVRSKCWPIYDGNINFLQILVYYSDHGQSFNINFKNFNWNMSLINKNDLIWDHKVFQTVNIVFSDIFNWSNISDYFIHCSTTS